MRLSLALAVVVAGVVFAVAEQPPASARGRDTVRVATFNIHKGADNDNHYDLQRTIATIAAFDADLVGLQEVLRNHAQFNCDDQAARIADGLMRLTNRKWMYVYVKSWVADDRTCMDGGRGSDVESEGVAFFAPQRIVGDHIRLAESRIGLVARLASLPELPVVVTHLAASRRNQAHREQQIAALLPWAEAAGAAILMGDLNARPEATELIPLFARYRDAWLEGTERDVATGVTTGSTRPGIQARIDYVFYDPSRALTLDSIEIRETATEDHAEVSDHRPVIATFRIPARARSSQ